MVVLSTGRPVVGFICVGILLLVSFPKIDSKSELESTGTGWFSSRQPQNGWTVQSIPNPMDQSKECGRRGVKSQICDPDSILPYESANVIESILNDITHVHGAQVAVVVVGHMGGGLDGEDGARELTKGLHDRWGVGDERRQDGMVLLLAVEDRQVYVSTGRGVKSSLDDRTLDRIISRMKPNLRNQKYDQAVEQAVRDIGVTLSGSSLIPIDDEVDDDGDDMWSSLAIVGIFVAGVGACMWRERAADNNFKRCTQHLESLQEARKRAVNRTYAATSCPICLEDFPEESLRESGKEAEGTLAGSSMQEDPGLVPVTELSSKSAATTSEQTHTSQSPSSSPSSHTAPSTSSSASTPLLPSPPAAAASAGSSAVIDPQKQPTCLPCGHVFCLGCISEWMRKEARANQVKCPVCRKPVDDAPQPAPRAPPPPPPPSPPPPPGCGEVVMGAPPQGTRPRGWGRNYYDQQAFHPEFVFRMAQLHRRYPSYVTRDLMTRWTDPMYDPEATQGFTRDATFTALSPQARREAASRGSRGSSRSSWGGGGSSGGGGRGGSW